MTLTNKYNLPDALVRAIEADNYEPGKPAFLSASAFSTPPRLRVLRKEHRGEIQEDAMDRIWALFGQAVHTILERASGADEVAEERLYGEIAGVTISGQMDTLNLATGVLCDYKITSAWSVIDGVKDEWTTQLNVLKWLCEQNGHAVERLEICAILRDWSKTKALGHGYPDTQVQLLDVPVWTNPELEITAIIRKHQQAEVELPECTPEERWARPDKWAVMKEGNNRATKLYDNPKEAQQHVDDTGSVAFRVEHRPGLNVRCASYCEAAAFCTQWEKLKNEQIQT